MAGIEDADVGPDFGGDQPGHLVARAGSKKTVFTPSALARAMTAAISRGVGAASGLAPIDGDLHEPVAAGQVGEGGVSADEKSFRPGNCSSAVRKDASSARAGLSSASALRAKIAAPAGAIRDSSESGRPRSSSSWPKSSQTWGSKPSWS